MSVFLLLLVQGCFVESGFTAINSIVKGHTLLHQGDVKSFSGGGSFIDWSPFPPSIAEMFNGSFPFAPVIFTDSDIDDNDYVVK